MGSGGIVAGAKRGGVRRAHPKQRFRLGRGKQRPTERLLKRCGLPCRAFAGSGCRYLPCAAALFPGSSHAEYWVETYGWSAAWNGSHCGQSRGLCRRSHTFRPTRSPFTSCLMSVMVGHLVVSGYNLFIASGAGPQAGRIAWTWLSGKCVRTLG